MRQETLELTLPSRLASVDVAAEQAARVVGLTELGDDALFGVDMAVREAVANAVLHGNQQDATKQVIVVFHYAADFLAIEVRDFGVGFVLDEVPDPTADANLLKTSGRGILFMRTFMDEVSWARHPQGGTVVRLVKKCASPTAN